MIPYECKQHGAWDAKIESACPACMVEARKQIATLLEELGVAVQYCCNQYWSDGHGDRVKERFGIDLKDDLP